MSNSTELLPLVAIIVAFKNDELVGEKTRKTVLLDLPYAIFNSKRCFASGKYIFLIINCFNSVWNDLPSLLGFHGSKCFVRQISNFQPPLSSPS